MPALAELSAKEMLETKKSAWCRGKKNQGISAEGGDQNKSCDRERVNNLNGRLTGIVVGDGGKPNLIISKSTALILPVHLCLITEILPRADMVRSKWGPRPVACHSYL